MILFVSECKELCTTLGIAASLPLSAQVSVMLLPTQHTIVVVPGLIMTFLSYFDVYQASCQVKKNLVKQLYFVSNW